MTLLTFVGTCTVRIKCVLGSFACTNEIFNLSTGLIINILIAHPYIRSAIFPLIDKLFCSSWRVTMMFLFFEETQKSIQDIIGDANCPGSFFSRQNCVYIYLWKKMVDNVTNVCNAQRPATFWMYFLRTKYQQLCCLALMGLFVRQKVESGLRNWRTISLGELSPPCAISFLWTCVKKTKKNHSIYGIIVSTFQ